MNLKEELARAQAILSATTNGWWQIEQDGDTWRVINEAGYTHQAPLVVADNMAKADAEALVYCHNLLPQFLAKLAESSDEG